MRNKPLMYNPGHIEQIRDEFLDHNYTDMDYFYFWGYLVGWNYIQNPLIEMGIYTEVEQQIYKMGALDGEGDKNWISYD